MKRALFVSLIPILLSGCLHKVGYNLEKSDRWTGPKINGTVYVEPFLDQTKFNIADWRPEHATNGTWRTNYRGGYDTTNLTDEVTAMIVKHLSYSGLFTKASEKDKDADFTLSGALVDFQTHGRVNEAAENIAIGSGAAFGLAGALVGAAATANMKTEIKTSVKLDDLKLMDRNERELWTNTISISNDVTVYFGESDSSEIFKYPDLALKEAVSEMIHNLGNSALTNYSRSIGNN